MTTEQVLVLVRALFASQIDRESNDLREWLLRQVVAALTIESQGDPVRAALDAAIRSDNEATAARARRALLALDAHDGRLPEDVVVQFANTGKEREETLVFVRECGERWAESIGAKSDRFAPNEPSYSATRAFARDQIRLPIVANDDGDALPCACTD